jgi:hypothetical protein
VRWQKAPTAPTSCDEDLASEVFKLSFLRDVFNAKDVYQILMIFTAWWYTYPSEKYMSSSLGIMTFPIYGLNQIHVPNHQPDP